MNRRIELLVGIIVLLALVACPSLVGDLKIVPPTIRNLTGMWVGHDRAGVEYLSVSFDTNEIGWLAFSYPDLKPVVVKIRSWSIKEYEIVCALDPIDSAAAEIRSVQLKYGGVNLECQLHLIGAERRFWLLRQDKIAKRLQDMQNAVDSARKSVRP